MREENLPPVGLREEDSGRVKRKKVMCSTRETKLTTYWGARSPLPTMDIRSIFVAEILFDGSNPPPPPPDPQLFNLGPLIASFGASCH